MLAGDLDLETADSAACAGDQDPLAGEIATMAQSPQRRRARDRKRGGRGEADPVRYDGEAVGRNSDVFGPAGLVDQGRDARARGRA
nr:MULTISPECIES: hypothetical protein [unclassified Mesorhizobium]